MTEYGINYGPMQQKIFAGRINKARTQMLDDKQDVTLHAVEAVGKYLIDNFENGTGSLRLGDKKLVISAHYAVRQESEDVEG